MPATKVVDKEMVQLWDRYAELQKGTIENFDVFLATSNIKLTPGGLEQFTFNWAKPWMGEEDAKIFAAFIQRRENQKK